MDALKCRLRLALAFCRLCSAAVWVIRVAGVDAVWILASDYPDAPLVYVSHDGEINRSFELWLGLLRDNGVADFVRLVGAQCAGGSGRCCAAIWAKQALAVRGDSLRAAGQRLSAAS